MSLANSGTTLVSCSDDKKVIVWSGNSVTDLEQAHVLSLLDPKNKPTKLLRSFVHPCQEYCMTFGTNGCYNFNNLINGAEAVHSKKICEQFPDTVFSAISIHVDGLLMAFAKEKEKKISVWSFQEDCLAIDIDVPAAQDGVDCLIRKIEFSENGFHVAVVGENVFAMLDLRKQKTVSTEVFAEEVNKYEGTVETTAAKFDKSGKFLAVAFCYRQKTARKGRRKASQSENALLCVYYYGRSKKFEKTLEIEVDDIVNDVAFGPEAKLLACCTSQRAVNVYKL